ncbi:Uncharacterised protein [Clostridium putrefaciens]|uniref:Uncharacterized protein n=2 Tax=Clostridium TaxID=1485 RepID=A0A381J7X6_9CLOT|nr:hypothetical protein BD821_11347 [Clostridium algidicarnis DSM 15099]SUY46556.1 Uncharacterised protein [Clostridium putrefaciens]
MECNEVYVIELPTDILEQMDGCTCACGALVGTGGGA